MMMFLRMLLLNTYIVLLLWLLLLLLYNCEHVHILLYKRITNLTVTKLIFQCIIYKITLEYFCVSEKHKIIIIIYNHVKGGFNLLALYKFCLKWIIYNDNHWMQKRKKKVVSCIIAMHYSFCLSRTHITLILVGSHACSLIHSFTFCCLLFYGK